MRRAGARLKKQKTFSLLESQTVLPDIIEGQQWKGSVWYLLLSVI